MCKFKLIFFIIFPLISLAQKEANNWFFGIKAGITFESGNPEFLLNSAMSSDYATASISDTAGNLLFYTDGKDVYNRNHQRMPNGHGLLGYSYSQTCVIVKKPESENDYYIFTVGTFYATSLVGLHYSIVRMSLDGGLGDVDNFYKNIPLTTSNLAVEKITAVLHANNRDVWVIVRQVSQPVNQFHAYLVTPAGVNPAMPSDCISNVPFPGSPNALEGQLKVSPDGKYLVCAIISYYGGFEICGFNNSTGEVTALFNLEVPLVNYHNWGVEFSPDCRFLYLSNAIGGEDNKIVQYDMTLIEDENSFKASMTEVGIGGRASNLQLGPDGKIYVARLQSGHIGVIHNPSLKGTLANYDSLGVYLGGRMSYYGLPQFIQTYFLRFEYTGICAAEAFSFTPNFHPLPDSIHWDFGDPGSGVNNTSNEFDPQHTYLQGGLYTVTAFVRYPGGRTETATREVTVTALPEPHPITDTVICKGSTVTLQADSGFISYLWSNNQTNNFIMVSDTGYYWVEAVNAEGCVGRDTIHVGWHPLAQLTPDTIISPTTCGNSIGAISGVNFTGGSPPYNVVWLNSQGDTVGITNNLYHLGVDNYYLWVTDQSGCQVLLASIDIQNFEQNLIITGVDSTDTWCNQPLGKLDVHVQSGLSDRLLYSIDNWVTNQTNGSFTGLLPDSYYVKVKDSLNCEAVYAGNPVTIQSLPGLTVTDVLIGEETDNNADGRITIMASGDTLRFSLDGAVPQVGNLFDSLSSGNYTVTVTDIHGCDSSFTVYVPKKSGSTLFASAGDTMVCNGRKAREPLIVSNFKDITSFEITLNYNSILLDAVGYMNAHSSIISGLEPLIYPVAGTIIIKWQGNALTLPDNTVLIDIVLQGKKQGLSGVDWVVTDNKTKFMNANGSIVPVSATMGSVHVASSPEIWGIYQENVCEHSPFSQLAIPMGGNGTCTITWDTPKGTINGAECKTDSAMISHSGLYRINVVDEMNCTASDSVQITVIPLPKANLPSINDTILFTPPYRLEANPDYYMYLWNTGENTSYITVSDEGLYTLIIKTEEGCADTTSVMMYSKASPSVEVPTAFTPNGDSLNDIFCPIVDKDRIRYFTLVIYNKWGQKVFETSDAASGWDGSNTSPGVYAWVISFVDLNENINQLKGSVALIK